MKRFLDILAAVLLFAVGALFAFLFYLGLRIFPWFAEPLWRTWLGIAAGIVGALAAIALLWNRRAGAISGISALVALAVVLVLNRLLPLGTFAIDGTFIAFLGVLLAVTGLIYWRFLFTAPLRR
jgi:hypothetical protein